MEQPRPTEIIDDPASFTRHILGNRFIDQLGIAEVQAVLEDQFSTRKKAADGDNRVGTNRDQYMFFQGAVMGMLIMAKQMKTHYWNSAWEQGLDPNTGKEIRGHGNG